MKQGLPTKPYKSYGLAPKQYSKPSNPPTNQPISNSKLPYQAQPYSYNARTNFQPREVEDAEDQDDQEEEEDYNQREQEDDQDDDDNDNDPHNQHQDDEDDDNDDNAITEQDQEESDQDDSVKAYKKLFNQPSQGSQNSQNAQFQRHQPQTGFSGNFDDGVDFNKVKNSKLYQKFLRESESSTRIEASQPNIPNESKPLSPNKFRASEETQQSNRTSSDSFKVQPTTQLKKKPEKQITEYKRPDEKFGATRNQKPGQPEFNVTNESFPGIENLPEKQSEAPPRQGFQRSQNWEGYSDNGESMANLNLVAQSNYVAVPSLQNSNNFGQYGYGNVMQQGGFPNQNYGGYPPYMGQYQGNHGMVPAKSHEYPSMQDTFLLNAKLVETSQNLQREYDMNRILESRCQEYKIQLEKSASNFEEFKRKIFEQNQNHQEEVSILQDRIQKLSDQLAERDRQESSHLEELSNLKRRFTTEANAKNKLATDYEEIQRKFEELNRIKRDKEGNLDQKDEEIMRLKKNYHSLKDENINLKSTEERLTATIKELNSKNLDLSSKFGDALKEIDEKNQRFTLMEIEVESLKTQLGNSTHQYRDLLSENENLKREVLILKERSMDSENEARTARMSNEKLAIEVNQLRQALARTEDMLEKERKQKVRMMQDNPPISEKTYSDPPDSSSNYEFNDKAPFYDRYERKMEAQRDIQMNKYDNFKPLQQREVKNERQQLVEENFYQKDRFEHVLSPKESPPKDSLAAQRYEEQFQKFGNRKNNASNVVFNDGSEQSGQRIKGVKTESVTTPASDPSQPTKMTTLNQVYKPTTDLLTWEEPLPVEKNKNRRRAQEPTRDVTPPKNQMFGVVEPELSTKRSQQSSGNPAKNQEMAIKNEQIKGLESNLMELNLKKDNLTGELQKLEKAKTTGAIIRKKQDMESEMNYINSNISNIKNKLRDLGALHPY